MTYPEQDALLNDLQRLQEDTPPVPADFHSGWLQLVEEDARMTQQQADEAVRPVKRRSGAWVRGLALAAALVFVVGGTLLTRDSLNPTAGSARKSTPAAARGGENGLHYAAEAPAAVNADYAAQENSFDMEEALEDSLAYEASGAADDSALSGAEARPGKIIRTVSLTIVTTDFTASLEQLRSLCTGMGGWVSSAWTSTSGSGLQNASLTLRVPAAQLDSYLSGTADAGRITSQSETAEDVSERYYDTKARLETQQALLTRLQALVTDAADLSDLLLLESEISDTQYTIDSLTASLNSTDRQVDYATVSVSLKEERPEENLQDASLSLGERIASGFRTGWTAFTGFLSDMAVFLVAALPFLLPAALVAVLAVVLHRRGRAKHGGS